MRPSGISRCLRALAFGTVFVGLASTIVHAAPACDWLPDFAVVERRVVNDLHLQALDLIADDDAPDRAKRAAAILQPFEDSLNAFEKSPDATPGRVAMGAADLARLALVADRSAYGTVAGEIMRDSFETLLSVAADAAEADYLVELAVTSAKSMDEQLEAVRRHRRISGDDVRQVAALLEMMRGYEEGAEQLALAALAREIAPKTGNDRAPYSADGAFLRAIVEGGGSADATARETAAALLPVARERLERTRAAVERGEIHNADDGCFAEDRVVRSINELLKHGIPKAEMEENYAVEALEAVTFGELETDYAGASEAYLELLTLRAIDDASYRDLMRYFALINPGSSGAADGEAGMALTGASVLESLLLPDLAREFLRDAKSWSEDAEPRLRFTTLSRALRFDWKVGGTSRLDEDVAEARTILDAHGAEIDPIERVQFSIFEAEFLDSRLDDRGATEALARAVDIALGEVDGPFAARNATMDFQADIAGLIVDHLRGRFCEGCDDMMLPIVERYWTAAVDYDIDVVGLGQSDSNVSRAMTLQLAASSGPISEGLRDRIDAELGRLASFVDGQVTPSSPARKILDRMKADERRRLLVAASLFPVPVDLVISGPWDRVIPLLAERDLGQKRRQLAPIVAMLAEHASEFGADMTVFDELDAYGRILADLRRPLDARVFFESVQRLAEADHGIQYWTQLSPVARRQLAKTLAPAYARLGRYAFEDKDWKAAAALLDEAGTLASDRLRQEWQVGNEQVGLLYRAFRPALQLSAQLRFFLATNDMARKSLPDALDRTFADLQSAMLGDTALAMQASIRNSIVRDDDLRRAVEMRDRARGRIAQIDATEALVPSKLPWVIAERRAAAEREMAEAEAVIAERLTISEDFAALAPATIGQAEAVLAADEALAVLHAGSNNIFGFVLRPGGKPFLFISKIPRIELSDRVAKLRREAAAFGAVDMANAAALYDVLLKPAEAELAGIGHLVVIADGPLPGLPWAMLATGASAGKTAGAKGAEVRGATPIGGKEEASGTDWAAQPFLIRRFPVSLAPSVGALVAQRPGLAASRATKPFLGVGNPLLRGNRAAGEVEIAALFSRDGGLDATALSDLAPLPETAAELTALAGSLGAGEVDLLLGDRATETALSALSLSDYRVLAFATHGILAGEVGGTAEPGLVLSPENSGDGRDGYLSLSEIMSLRLDADLVILSACNTGGADGRPRAEWMSGLARGFIAAGARQLLVTLWSIPSQPTVRLTTGMTEAYAREPGLGWPRALQRSILAMLDDPQSAIEAHPASWASFTVLGVDAMRR